MSCITLQTHKIAETNKQTKIKSFFIQICNNKMSNERLEQAVKLIAVK